MRMGADGSRGCWQRWLLGFAAGWIGFNAAFQANAAGVVSVADEAHLRQALNGGGTVTFDCDGTIYLASTIVVTNDVVLDASGRSIALSGSNAVRVLTVASNVSLDLRNLTVADGRAIGGFTNFLGGFPEVAFDGVGGGICSTGRLQILNCVFTNNLAIGSMYQCKYTTAGQGGAIYNLGTMVVSNSLFADNHAIGGEGHVNCSPGGSGYGGGPGQGGAIYNLGTATVASSVFVSNSTLGGRGSGSDGNIWSWGEGGSGGPGGLAQGSGLFNAGAVAVSDCTFSKNTAIGGTGGSAVHYFPSRGTGGAGGWGGPAEGAGVLNSGSAWITGCTFYQNSTLGGITGPASAGVPATQAGPGGVGGSGGRARGAAICALGGILNLTNCTIVANTATGGNGSAGGNGGQPGIPGKGGDGGAGGNGGNAIGGGVSGVDASIMLANCTISGSLLQAGNAGAGGSPTEGFRGGWGVAGVAGTNGVASGSAVASSGSGGSGLHLINSIVAGDGQVSNCSGVIYDGGYNLCSDGSGNFTKPGSLNETDPQLLPLDNYGGSTLTLALMPGSQAINAGDPLSFPPEDQRGVARPQSLRSDIGAFEYDLPILPLAVSVSFTTNPISALEHTTLKIQISNPNPFTLSNVSFTVTLPENSLIADPPNVGSDRGADIPTVPGTNRFSSTAFTLASLQSCTATVDVTSAYVGVWSGGRIAATNSALGTTHVALPALRVVLPPGYATITECQDLRLRWGLLGGGRITFACDGTVVLTNTLTVITNTILDGSGHAITISGNNAFRLFNVPTGVNLTLINLTLADGRSTNGGAIYSQGTLNLMRTTFVNNQAIGNAGVRGFDGTNGSGTCYLPGTPGGNGGPGDPGSSSSGGALYNAGLANICESMFQNNLAIGGAGGSGGAGGYGGCYAKNGVGGTGGAGGKGFGGAIYNTSDLMLTNCTFTLNSALGGFGGDGAHGKTYVDFYAGVGGEGGRGGDAFGGAIYSGTGTVFALNVTLVADVARGGNGGLHGTNYYCGSCPAPQPGTNGFSTGHNLMNQMGSFALKNCIVANPPGVTNASGVFADLGNNLSTDASCNFTHPASLSNTDPKLGPLGDYGGPTKTVVLLPGSPAIDAGDNDGGPAVDQRGVPRPQLSRCDIGAFEFSFGQVGMDSAQAHCLFSAVPNREYAIEVSSNLLDWTSLLQTRSDLGGELRFQDEVKAGSQFYRTRLLEP